MPLGVAANDNGGVSQLSWVHGNHMGVPAVYSDASGSETPMPTGYSAPGFPGQSRTFADLYYNRYRDYDPTTGRYIQADPIGLAGGPSPYSYAMNNPLRYTDPTGEFVPILVGIGIGVAFEYFTNECATAEDLLWAGAFGSIGGGVGGAGIKFGGRRVLRQLWGDTSGAVTVGRSGKQARLRELVNDPRISSRDRGWIRQELNQITRGKRNNIRVPIGKNLGHRRGFEAKRGFDYRHSQLQDIDLHKLQHRHGGY